MNQQRTSYNLDRRSRRDEDRRHILPNDFFLHEVPKLIAAHGPLVAQAIEVMGAPSLTVEVDMAAWTLHRTGATVKVRQGAVDDALRITLSSGQFSDWAQNQVSLNGFMVSRSLQFRNGSTAEVSLWDSLWMALLEGWPVTASDVTFLNRASGALYLDAAFTPADDPDDIAHFLREAGYLRLKGWLDPNELAVISADMDRVRPLYKEGDGKSWWATLADGSRTCVRLQEFVEHSPVTARLLEGNTWKHLRRVLAGRSDSLACKAAEGRIIEALFKPIGVVAGPSDLPFHRDCHLGRHSYVCSRLTLGIPLTASSEANGMLQVIAGSHRAMMPAEFAKTGGYLPILGLATEPGDITVHLSCTLHASTAPLVAERRVMYTEMPLASRDDGAAPVDTSVNDIRERVNDILRDEHEKSREKNN